MFQRLAIAFKTKTIEFFAENSHANDAGQDNDDTTTIDLSLDSTDEILTDQRVVVIKPDHQPNTNTNNPNPNPLQTQKALISSLFASISSFQAAYLHLQTAHVPFEADSIQEADRVAVSHLQRLSQLKQLYLDCCKNSNSNSNFPLPASHLEAQVQENQTLLRTFGTIINRLQSEIERKDAEASVLQQKLEAIEESNLRLMRKLDGFDSSSSEVLLSVSLFDSVLQDTYKAAHNFTKILIGLMKKTGWDLDSLANSIYPGIGYAKRGHNRYAFFSYVCLGMFVDFDLESFGLEGLGIVSDLSIRRKKFMKKFVGHGSVDATNLLSRKPNCDFARFCKKKYQQLIHPNMESALFMKSSDNQNESLLSSWQSSPLFHESFVNMASLVWMLHKLAFSFDPTVEIFQVGTGVDFSMVYMENIARASLSTNSDGMKTNGKVGFTVIPGFKVGETIIQCQVYINAMNCAE